MPNVCPTQERCHGPARGRAACPSVFSKSSGLLALLDLLGVSILSTILGHLSHTGGEGPAGYPAAFGLQMATLDWNEGNPGGPIAVVPFEDYGGGNVTTYMAYLRLPHTGPRRDCRHQERPV